MIRALQAASGDVVVVATVPTIEPYGDIREYAVKLFENHGRGIGQKGKNNGLLILLALKERRVWVEVGYDLEEWITDGFAGETSREYMTPEFRNGRYGAGCAPGTERIIGRIAQGRNVTLEGVRRARGRRRDREAARRSRIWLPIVIFIVILILSRIGGGGGRRSRFWGGGGWSSGVGPFGGGFGGGGFGAGAGRLRRRLRRVRRRQQRRRRRRLQLVEMLVYEDDAKNADAGGRARACAALPLTGCSYNKFVAPGRGDQGAVGAGREPAAAAQRPDPESRRDDQGLRAARGRRLQGHRRRALAAARREVARGDDRGGEPADRPRSAGCSPSWRTIRS